MDKYMYLMSMLKYLKRFLIPEYKNGFYPYLVRKPAIVVYTLVILGINLLNGFLGGKAYAGSISSSDLVALANKERTALGLSELNVDSRLVAAAYSKAENIFELQYWNHYGPNGETPWQFIIGADYAYVYAGENLAKGFSSSDAVHSAWMASKTHRENIVNPDYKDVGIAIVSGNLNGSYVVLVVQMFGTVESENTSSMDRERLSEGESVKITSPEDNSLISDRDVEIEGLASSEVENVEIYDKGESRGSIINNGGVWTYREPNSWNDGRHEIEAVDEISGNEDIVNFTVDTDAPDVVPGSIIIEESDGNIDGRKVSLKTSGDASRVTVVSGEVTLDLSQVEKDTFEGVIPDNSEIENMVRVFASDKAGNYSVSETNDEVLGVASVQEAESFKPLSNISVGNVVTSFNRIAVGAIAILLVVDAIYLVRLNIFSTRGKPLFPMAIWVLIVGVGLSVGSGGNIL